MPNPCSRRRKGSEGVFVVRQSPAGIPAKDGSIPVTQHSGFRTTRLQRLPSLSSLSPLELMLAGANPCLDALSSEIWEAV